MSRNFTALIDLDSMTHIIAAVQYSAGNKDNPEAVKNHAKRFVSNICKNSSNKEVILMYQSLTHTNFRKDILPEYKGHRTKVDAIELWKPTIVEAYSELNALELQFIESDDAQSILAEELGYENVVIVTGDKDMQQVPTTFYNPYKKNLKAEDRWGSMNMYQANRFFWMQVLAGDPTDMPGELCGIEGVGMKTADKMCDQEMGFYDIVKKEYSKKYGSNAFRRANLTYQMVRLLKKDNNNYINQSALEEVNTVLSSYSKFIHKVGDSSSPVFATDALNLFQ